MTSHPRPRADLADVHAAALRRGFLGVQHNADEDNHAHTLAGVTSDTPQPARITDTHTPVGLDQPAVR